jgi:chemotaxis protein histidine kinase CheA
LRGTVQIETRPRGGTRLNVHIPHPIGTSLDVPAPTVPA